MGKAIMRAFRALPQPVRRTLVHLGTPSFTVGAVLVLRRADGRVLLVDQRHTGAWALPGGLLRRRERPEEGLVREVKEEVGIQLDVSDLSPPIVEVDPVHRRVDLAYLAEGEGRSAHPADEAEVRRIGWFALDDLPRMTEGTAELLAALPR